MPSSSSNSNIGSCISCNEQNGYVIKSNQCLQCNSSCKTCTGTQATECKVCKDPN